MSKRRRRSRPRRAFESKAKSYTHLGIEQLEDRCFLSASPLSPLGQPATPQPTDMHVLFVEPVANGPTVSWMPVAELTVGGIVPSPVEMAYNQLEYSFGHDFDQDGSSILQLEVGDELITFNWSTPLNAQLTAPNLAPYGLSSSSALSSQFISSSLNNLGGNAKLYGVDPYNGLTIMNAGTDDPAASLVLSGATLTLNTAGASPAMTAMLANGNVADVAEGLSPVASSTQATDGNLTQTSLAPAPVSKAAPPGPAVPTNSFSSAAPSVPVQLDLDSVDDSISAVKQNGLLSAPTAAVSSPATGSPAQNPSAIGTEVGNTPTNPAGGAENLQHLVPLPLATPAEKSSPLQPGLIHEPPIEGVDQATSLPADAATSSSVMPQSTIVRSQAVMLSHLSLDVRAIDQALENLLDEIDQIGSGLAGWWAVSPVPRWTIIALALAGAAAGSERIRRARRRRKSPYEQTTEADSLSWMFSTWQGMVPEVKEPCRGV